MNNVTKTKTNTLNTVDLIDKIGAAMNLQTTLTKISLPQFKNMK